MALEAMCDWYCTVCDKAISVALDVADEGALQPDQTNKIVAAAKAHFDAEHPGQAPALCGLPQ